MTKVTIPDPVGYIVVDQIGKTEFIGSTLTTENLGAGEYGIITTDQAEAYANACVREALEHLAKIAKDRYEIALSSRGQCEEGEDEAVWDATATALAFAYQTMKNHIDELIKEPPCDT